MLARIAALFLAVCVLGISTAGADDFYIITLEDLKIQERLEALPGPEGDQPEMRWYTRWRFRRFQRPYAVGTHSEEIYFMPSGFDMWRRQDQAPPADAYMAIRVPDGVKPAGTLYWPRVPRFAKIDFQAPEGAVPGGDAAKRQYCEAKVAHYQELGRQDLPGGAWFRHEVRQARTDELGEPDEAPAENDPRRRQRDSDMQRTYALFTGGRAVSENLQLDRELRVGDSADPTIGIETLPGIDTKEFDWTPLIEGKTPEKDPLAALIPADQHALFFPSFKAMTDLLDETKARGTPVLRLLEPRAEDAKTHERYERQLLLEMDAMSRLLGPKVIRSVAFTGSDPYLRTGSDVAVLFEAVDTAALRGLLVVRRTKAGADIPQRIVRVDAEVAGIPYSGFRTRDRSVCSYLAVVGQAVVVTNSLAQLERIARAASDAEKSIDEMPEYVFFRDRYPRADAEETALLVLTDATIRRWCNPKWRIATSRRTRAAAVMMEMRVNQVRKGPRGEGPRWVLLNMDDKIPGLGKYLAGVNGPWSEVYNTLDFLTPIVELDIDKVTEGEAAAYNRFRSRYQGDWQEFFDPIAVRFTVKGETMAADMTVRPLIAGSEYRDAMEVCGASRLTGTAGDRHPEALIHFAMALDVKSEPIRRIENFATQMTTSVGLGWLGDWAAIYVDKSPLWEEMTRAIASGDQDMNDFLEDNIARVPIAIEVAVRNPLTLAATLTGIRAFANQSAPGLLRWETIEYKERAYVKVSPQEREGGRGGPDFVVCYAPMSDRIVISLSEEVVKRALDRVIASKPADTAEGWHGESMAGLATNEGLQVIRVLYREQLSNALRYRSFANLTILNEWRHRFGVEDPIAFHERLWGVRLVCPGGGEYVWNEDYRTMESTVFGHPANPTVEKGMVDPLADVESIAVGVTFEEDGLRARATVVGKER